VPKLAKLGNCWEIAQEIGANDSGTFSVNRLSRRPRLRPRPSIETWFGRSAAIAPRYSGTVTNVIQIGLVGAHLPVVRSTFQRRGMLSNREVSYAPPNSTVIRNRTRTTSASVQWATSRSTICLPRWATSTSAWCSLPKVKPLNVRHEVTVNKVGVYVWDTFDFNGSQSLGYWNDENNTMSRHSLFGSAQVRNDDFVCVEVVFSDVKWTTLPTPDVFVT